MITLYSFNHHGGAKHFSKKPLSKVARIIGFVALGIYATAAFILLMNLLPTGMLPMKYVMIAVGVLLFIAGLHLFFCFYRHTRSIVIYILSVLLLILSVGMAYGTYYISKTVGFIDNIQVSEYYTETYSVFVLEDSRYQTLEDLSETSIASFTDTIQTYDQAFEELKSVLKFNTNVTNNYLQAAKMLLNGQADFILLSNSYREILDDMIEGFSTKIRSVYDIEIRIYDTAKTVDVDIVKEPFNLYISGIDTSGKISTISRSDVNMIVTVNPQTHKILLTSIPRDYFVQFHGTTGRKDKLTHTGIYGINMSIHTIEDFMNITLNYYVRVNFDSVINLVDAIGGIDIYSDASFRAWTNPACWFNANHTSHEYGRCALAFARERMTYSNGDIHRVQNQQQVLTAIFNKVVSPSIITNYPKILDAISDNFETSIPTRKIYEFINKQLDTMDHWEIESYNLDGTGEHSSIYSEGMDGAGDNGTKYFVMIPDETTIEIARNKINAVLNGE